MATRLETDNKELEPVPYFQLFRFSSGNDKLCLVVAGIASLVASGCFPVLIILSGEVTDIVVSDKLMANCSTNTTRSNATLLDSMAKISIYMLIVGSVHLLCGYLFISIFHRVAENMAYRIRIEYIRSLLRQDVSWYDTVEDRNFVGQIAENVAKVQDAVGEKFGLCLHYFLTGVVCLAFAFWYGWLLTLVMLGMIPLIALLGIFGSMAQSKLSLKEQRAYDVAGLGAQQVLANIKTVMAFSGQAKEVEEFSRKLLPAERASRLKGIVSALIDGLMWFMNYCTYSLAIWYGTKLIFDNRGKNACNPEFSTISLVVVFLNVLTSAFCFADALTYIEYLTAGKGSAASVYRVIERIPDIDTSKDTGRKPTNERAKGRISLNDVYFSYPSRDITVLQGISFTVDPGTTIALVGNSGSGKSTCMQLLQRFYDPTNGSVCIDGVDIRELNIHWYRSQLGVVSQEPYLFNVSITENVRYGKMNATQEEVENACKMSNAHEFISGLPMKYETLVGEGGAQLSGGQKQRIAIARALVRNPPVLLLDEATSALDTQSEALVQRALDRARRGRTTIIVAHRLSTIRDADVILVIKDGKIAERGSHSELLAMRGLYYELVFAQTGGESSTGQGDIGDLLAMESSEEREHDELPGPDQKPQEIRGTFLKLMRLNGKEWYWILAGFILSVAQGLSFPLVAYYYGEYTDVLSEHDAHIAMREALKYAIIFLIIGFVSGFCVFTSLSCFCVAGAALTCRLRKLVFEAMVHQDVGWFANPKNTVGSLCARLSGDAASVQGATGTRLGIVAYTITTISISIVLGLYVAPKLGVVGLAFAPLIIVSNYYNDYLLEQQQFEEKLATEKAAMYAHEAATGIRTVASLSAEKKFVQLCSDALYAPHVKAVSYSHCLGIVHGLSQAFTYFANAAVFYYGAYLIQNENIEYYKIFVVSESLIWSMLFLGQTLAFTPSYSKAKVAGSRILQLLGRKPALDYRPEVGIRLDKVEGGLSFDKVEFIYPVRRTKVLKGLSFGVKPHQHIALCGPSGSGKSTCIEIILRYYDPTSGTVKLDDTNTRTLNLDFMRNQMAIVAQEPSLFDRTVGENIAYGDNSRTVPMEDIIDSARSANIHDFITSLPAGYDTRVGDLGTQLSGGQKQRIAIARALLRKPKVLLLDEATSALDSESEKLVQDSLDNASTGRTCVTIAHRLSSIQHADIILVVYNGVVVESGTHKELLDVRGIYSQFWNMQTFGGALG